MGRTSALIRAVIHHAGVELTESTAVLILRELDESSRQARFGGFKIVEDSSIPPGEVQFHRDGRCVGMIIDFEGS